ncbi:MAG: hypothetical protein Q4F97_10310 [Bacteroidales bacterium]|nr:hypothetical protein [Bacteroidales bacterium]
MKKYEDKRINEFLNDLESTIKLDEEYSYRDIEYDLNTLYENIDKIVAYVKNDYKGDLYLNSNVWNPCYDTLVKVLRINNLKLIGCDKVTEKEQVVFIKNRDMER